MKLISFHKQTDKELVKSCLANDRIAQKKLFDSYKDAMYTTAFRMLGNERDASDVLQETFIDVFENLSGFRFESTLGAWIKVILVRKALRKLKLQNDFQDLQEAEHLHNDGWNQDFTSDDLEKAIQSLPDSARTVFLLVEVEGFKHHEVAIMLNISTGTSKSQLHYSKMLLRRKLKELRG
jgi:RNA polymerase sigma-70 factor (ECF subfamily)